MDKYVLRMRKQISTCIQARDQLHRLRIVRSCCRATGNRALQGKRKCLQWDEMLTRVSVKSTGDEHLDSPGALMGEASDP